jgi:flavodoxin
MPKYIIFIFPDAATSKDMTYEIVQDDEKLVDKIYSLTKENKLFSVYRVGDCIGDYS